MITEKTEPLLGEETGTAWEKEVSNYQVEFTRLRQLSGKRVVRMSMLWPKNGVTVTYIISSSDENA